MKIIEGNLLDQDPGILCQQVNLLGVMGAGLALQIKKKWPRVYDAYHRLCLGEWEGQPKPNLGEVHIGVVSPKLIIANLFGQREISRGECATDYAVYPEMLRVVRLTSEQTKLPVYIPHGIGCGLGGGDWRIMSLCIEEHLPEAIIVKWNGV